MSSGRLPTHDRVMLRLTTRDFPSRRQACLDSERHCGPLHGRNGMLHKPPWEERERSQ